MEPIVDELEDEYGGEFDFVRVDIDTAQGRDLAREHGFIGQPTFIFFNEAGEEVRRFQGERSSETLEQAIEQALGR